MEKEMATYSTILAWEIPWTEESGALQSMGRKRVDMTQQLNNNSETANIWMIEIEDEINKWKNIPYS